MPCCAIKTCRLNKNSLEARRGRISYHRFPKIPEKKLEWLRRINRPGWEPREATVICSRHFTTQDFLDRPNRKKLLKDAIPSLNLHEQLDPETMAKKARERKPYKKKHKYKDMNHSNQEQDIMDLDESELKDITDVHELKQIAVADIKVETTVDQLLDFDPETIQDSRLVIADIIKSIICSLELLVKADPDSVRSSKVRDKIVITLFCYHEYLEDKDVNTSFYKDSATLDKADMKDCDGLFDESKEIVFEDPDQFDVFNDNFDDDNDDYIDETEEQEPLSDDKTEEMSLIKLVEMSRMQKKERRAARKLKKQNALNKKSKKKRLKTREAVKSDNEDEGVVDNESIGRGADSNEEVDDDDDKPIKDEFVKRDFPDFVSTVPRFTCDICDITVINEHHLTVHKHMCRRRHYYYGNPPLEEFWENIRCPLCDVKCNHRGNLGRHYVTHRVKDIERAFEPIKEKELDPTNPEKNMKMLNDFMIEFENGEQYEKEKAQKATISNDTSNMDMKSENELENKDNFIQPKAPSIDDYIKFNLRKVVYDVDFNKELICFPCDIMFNTKDELEEHRKKLNDMDSFVCNYCDKTFSSPTPLINHTKKHKGLYNPKSLFLNYKAEDCEGCPCQIDYKIYVCKYCLIMFVQESSLQSHMGYYKKNLECYMKIHKAPKGSIAKRTPPGIMRTEDDKLQCNKCTKSYKNYYLFMEHLSSHSEISKYQCECGKGFKSKQRLKFHINLVHNRKFEVICDVCGVKVLYFNLKRHKMVHSNLKPHKCPYCSKMFKYKESITTHLRTHTREKPWQCQYCGMAFSEKRRYNIHINIHEGKTPYKCNLCPSAFVSKLKLNKHVLEHQDCRL